MKQLGNLSIVCAQRTDVLMQIYGGQVSVHVGKGRSGLLFLPHGMMTK